MFGNFSREDKLDRLFQNGMIHRNDGDGEGGGGEGGEPAEKTFTEAEVKAMLEKETSGLKTKNKELLDKYKSVNSIAEKFKDVDVDNLLEFKSKVEQDEILRLASEGKHQEAIDKALEKERVTAKAQQEKLIKERDEWKAKFENSSGQLNNVLIDREVESAFRKEKGFEGAVKDAVTRAASIFSLDESGEVVARDSEGNLIQGEEGPLTITEFVKNLKKEAPHFFPESAGGLGNGGKGGEGGAGEGTDEELIAAAAKGPAELRRIRAKRRQAMQAR